MEGGEAAGVTWSASTLMCSVMSPPQRGITPDMESRDSGENVLTHISSFLGTWNAEPVFLALVVPLGADGV